MRPLAPLATFVAVVVGANLMTAHWGLVTWLGVTATAGTWLAGFAFVTRDWLQERAGRRWVLVAIAVGALLSAVFSPRLALASGTAFALSELADLAVYTPLRQRSRLAAALVSNTVGAFVDTVAFLLLAGFPLSALPGQMLIKVGTTTLFIGGSHALLRQPVRQRGGDPGDA